MTTPDRVFDSAHQFEWSCDDPVMAEQMATRGRELVRNCYTWTAAAERLEDVFLTMIEPPVAEPFEAACTPR